MGEEGLHGVVLASREWYNLLRWVAIRKAVRIKPVTSEVRSFLPIDLPLIHRLAPQGISLDAAVSLTRGVHTVGSAFWSAVPLTDLGTPTLVLRNSDGDFIAQFRHRAGESHAHIVFIAPDLNRCRNDNGWLSLIDAMTSAAGKRGALTLTAEVAETGDAFTLLRQCGFAVYGHQEIWWRPPSPDTSTKNAKYLFRGETEADRTALEAFYSSVVPRSIWQAAALPESTSGLIYDYDGRIGAYFAMQEGRTGIFAQIVIRPELSDRAATLCQAWLAHLPRAERVPVYVGVRRYQSGLCYPLAELNFVPWGSHAMLVKHTVARIERPLLRTVAAIEGAVQVGPVTRPLPKRVARPRSSIRA